MFAQFAEQRGGDRSRARSSPGSAATGRRCCCCTVIRRRTSCGTRPRRGWPSGSRSSRRPARLRRVVPARCRPPITRPHSKRAAGRRSGAGDGRARLRAVRGRRPRPRRPRRLPDGARPPRAGRARSAVFDVVPTGEVWARADARFALVYWHWAFLAQPAPLPERLIAGDPDAFFDFHVRALGLGATPGRYPAELLAAYRRPARRPEHRRGDLRGLPRRRDDRPRARRRRPRRARGSSARCSRSGAPRGALPRLYGDVLEVWRTWAREVSGRGLEASHFLVEDRPEDVADGARRPARSPTRSTTREAPPNRRPDHVQRHDDRRRSRATTSPASSSAPSSSTSVPRSPAARSSRC